MADGFGSWADIQDSLKAGDLVGRGSARKLVRSVARSAWGYKVLTPALRADGTPWQDDFWKSNQNTAEFRAFGRYQAKGWEQGVRMPQMEMFDFDPPLGPVLGVEIIDSADPLPHGPNSQECICRGNWSGCYVSVLRRVGLHELLDCRITGGDIVILDAG